MNDEIVFLDTSGEEDIAYVVKVDQTGKVIRQDPPGRIPDGAQAISKANGGNTPLGFTYGDFVSQPQERSIGADGEPVGDYTGQDNTEEELKAISESLKAQNGVNQSYGPNGIYDPNKPIKIDVPGKLIKGAEGRPISIDSVKSFPQGELNALGVYGSPGIGIQDLSREAAIAVSNNNYPSPQQINGVYASAVRYAAAKDISVQAALRDMIAMGEIVGKKDGSGSGYGPFSSTTTDITQTDELEAERILNSALSTYLGRRADADEINKFVKQLNKNERFNPTVTKTTGVRTKNNTTQQSTRTGGFDSAGFAERWARSREGAAEYQAATTYMDAFQSVIDGMEY